MRHRISRLIDRGVAARLLRFVAVVETVALAAISAWLLALRLSSRVPIPRQLGIVAAAVAVVIAAGAALLMVRWLARWAIRRRFRYGLREQMVLVAVLGLGMALLFGPIRQEVVRRRIQEDLRRARGVVAALGGITAFESRSDAALADFSGSRGDIENVENNAQFIGKRLTDGQLEDLARHPNLVVLVLENCRITDAGLLRLGEARKLRVLILKGSTVGDGAVRELQSALPDCRIER